MEFSRPSISDRTTKIPAGLVVVRNPEGLPQCKQLPRTGFMLHLLEFFEHNSFNLRGAYGVYICYGHADVSMRYLVCWNRVSWDASVDNQIKVIGETLPWVLANVRYQVSVAARAEIIYSDGKGGLHIVEKVSRGEYRFVPAFRS